jgi:tRNA threonylcarbamoyladenosine biosynthesis protein TsaE
MPERRELTLTGPEVTERVGRALGSALAASDDGGVTIWLEGELGAGKTSMARAILEGLGYEGRVPSPTYTLVEPYELSRGRVYHVDLYRLQSSDEADELGLAELPGPDELLLVEWPERGGERVPAADLRLGLAVRDDGRRLVALAAGPVTPQLSDWLDFLTTV